MLIEHSHGAYQPPKSRPQQRSRRLRGFLHDVMTRSVLEFYDWAASPDLSEEELPRIGVGDQLGLEQDDTGSVYLALVCFLNS